MAFVVLVKNVSSSIQPDQIINLMGNNNIPMGENIKYYKVRKLDTEKQVYTLYIKYSSFKDSNEKMCNFHNELINYKWIKLQINDNLTFKICMKKIDYYNFIYGNFTYGDYAY